MLNPIILSDDEKTPIPCLSKKPRTQLDLLAPVFIIDDDPTPQKPPPTSSFSSTPSFVAETPMSDLSIVKWTSWSSNSQNRVFDSDNKLSGNSGVICLESKNDESEGGYMVKNWNNKKAMYDSDFEEDNMGLTSRNFGSMDFLGDDNLTQKSEDQPSEPVLLQDNINQATDDPDKKNFSMEKMSDIIGQSRTDDWEKENRKNKALGKKKLTKEERTRLMEEKKLKKEQDKLQKVALKAQVAELKKLDKEKQKWETGKFALKFIVAEIDTKVVEQRSIGGHLLSRFAEKGLTYRIMSNPIEKSIVWTMSVPEHISELSPKGSEIRYVLLVYEAEEFCNLVINESLFDHVSTVQRCYSSYTVCYLTNRLMTYINKREKEQYKNPGNDNGWRRPPIEEVLAKLTTQFVRVHYRNCIDEAELAEHVVGLTCSLASCQFRNKLTRLSVNANGSLILKDCTEKNVIKKSPWLKALVSIPKVQPRFAVAIWKKYPTMKSLLRVYMDPSISVHDKEFLLEELTTEGILGGERRVGRICSKRVYRILMAQSGGIKTDDVEDGADFFRHQSS